MLSNDFLEEVFAETEIHRAKKRGPEGKRGGVPALNASIRPERGKGVVRGLPLFTRVRRETVRKGARATLRGRGFRRYTEREKGLRVLCSASFWCEMPICMGKAPVRFFKQRL